MSDVSKWFGGLRPNWDLSPLWTLFHRDSRRGFPEETLLSVYREYGVIPKESRADNNNRSSEDLSTYQLVEPGDLVVNKMKAWQGSMAISRVRGIVSPAYFIFRPTHRCEDRYLHYLLRSQPMVGIYKAGSKGIRPSQWDLDPQRFAQTNVPTPPVEEQRAIADYLDCETQKIDELITEQRSLIETLRERRKAVITRAVTVGIRDDARMQQVDEPALDQIPKSWQIRRIKTVGRAIIGLTYTPEDIVDEGEGRLVLRAGNIQRGALSLENNVYVDRKLPEDLKIREGDIVICARNGSSDLIGKNAVATQEVVGETWGAFMAVLRSDINEYLRWVLNSEIFRAQTGLFSTSTINQLTSKTLHNLKFGLPSESERNEISRYLDEQTSRIDALISESEDLIALSEERRAALITAAVTGQIDVRTTS